jgi:hypothetical protein
MYVQYTAGEKEIKSSQQWHSFSSLIFVVIFKKYHSHRLSQFFVSNQKYQGTRNEINQTHFHHVRCQQAEMTTFGLANPSTN